MTQRAQPPQDGRDQPAHQRAVAVGKTFQSGVGGGAVELLVERAALVQDAIENVGRDPSRRKTRYFRRQSKTLRGHGVDTSCNLAQQFACQFMLVESDHSRPESIWHENMPIVRIRSMTLIS